MTSPVDRHSEDENEQVKKVTMDNMSDVEPDKQTKEEQQNNINEYMEELDDIQQESLITQYGNEGANEALDAVEAWMPNSDEMKDETNVDPSQVRGLAAARTLAKYFPELAGIEDALNDQLDDYEKYAVSQDGKGREEQVDVLRGVFGQGRTQVQDGEGGSVNVFANPDQKE